MSSRRVFLSSWFLLMFTVSLVYLSAILPEQSRFITREMDRGLPQRSTPLAQTDLLAQGSSRHASTTTTTTTTSSTTETIATPAHFFDSRSPDGSLGYIADPYALRRGVEAFLSKKNNTPWDLLVHYSAHARTGIYNATTMSLASICSFGPGQSLEEEGGFRILTEKIQIAAPVIEENKQRILCLVYTHPPMHDLARTAALTWGWKCHGFLAFTTTSTNTALGMVHFVHPGPESYANMWQKVRSIWHYVHQHYRDDFDYMHLCGDDTYVLVNNLQRFLSLQHLNDTQPLHAGQWIGQKYKPYIAGGPGYTINRETLNRFVQSNCHADTVAYYEDRLFSQCVQRLGVDPADTRDALGQQSYHDCSPHTLYTSRSSGSSFHARGMAYWEKLLPNKGRPQIRLDAAAAYSVAFHQLYNPLYMTRVHAILHPDLCPADSVLGKGLRYYRIAQ